MRAFLKAAALALAVSLLATPIMAPVAAFAEATVTTPAPGVVDLNPLLDASVKILADLVLAVGGVIALGLAKMLHDKWGVDVQKQVSDLEANYRDTLHSAVETWTKAEIAKHGPNLSFNVGSPELANVINGVAKSAPDAVAYLQPTENWLAAKAAGVLGVVAPVIP